MWAAGCPSSGIRIRRFGSRRYPYRTLRRRRPDPLNVPFNGACEYGHTSSALRRSIAQLSGKIGTGFDVKKHSPWTCSPVRVRALWGTVCGPPSGRWHDRERGGAWPRHATDNSGRMTEPCGRLLTGRHDLRERVGLTRAILALALRARCARPIRLSCRIVEPAFLTFMGSNPRRDLNDGDVIGRPTPSDRLVAERVGFEPTNTR